MATTNWYVTAACIRGGASLAKGSLVSETTGKLLEISTLNGKKEETQTRIIGMIMDKCT